MHRRYLLFALMCVMPGFCRDAFGQLRKYSSQQFTEEVGLAQNFTYGVIQDERGFLWIGTGVGLSRYDGYEIKNFRQADSLSADFITADFRTSSGSLVFGHSGGGITLFDGLRFRPLLPDTLGNVLVSITEDAEGDLWAATQSKGLMRIDHGSGEIFNVMPTELESQIVNVISIRSGMLWVGTNEGLFFFKIHDKTLTYVENDLLPPFVTINTIVAHQSNSELTWVGTSFKGIFLLRTTEEGGGTVVQHTIALPEFSDYVIQALAEDLDGDLWVGTGQHGVLHLNIGRDGKSVFKMESFRKSSGFPVQSVNKIIVDRQGLIWVSTAGDGIVKIYKQLFTYFPFASRFGVTDVRSIAETRHGYLVATDVGLLQITLDVQSDEYEVQRAPVLRGEPVLSVYTDSHETTWVGTENKGVFIYHEEKGALETVDLDTGAESLQVRLFEEDADGNIWISARAMGVYQLNRDKQILRHLTTANKFIHNDVFAIKVDSKGNIWFGTYGAGLAMIDKEGDLNLFSKDETLRARDINDIDEDASGNIWIATEGEGFFRYTDQKFTQIGSVENLISPFIKGMQFDPTGRIWFSYRKGLGYYDLLSEKKYHFTRQDGLLPSEAYSSSIIVDSKLNKWFCNDFGVTLFENDTVSDTRKELVTYLTGLRIFFKDFPANFRNETGLKESRVGKLPTLELTHEENHITFDYAAIKLNRSGKIYYRHWLEGYDADWTPPKTANFVTYTNLDPGKYKLKVQATDDLSSWVDPVTEYSFVITPPFWKRTWFYLLQIVSVLTLYTLTYLIGKRGLARKRFVVRLMLFSSFFITLEYVENFVDPLASGVFGGAPVFRFFLNFILALLLLPVETLITHWMMNDERPKEASQPEPVSIPETDNDAMLEADHLKSRPD